MATGPADLFPKLLECKFKGIGFPIAEVNIEVEQTLARHKRPGRAGATLEGTGREPLKVDGTAYFYNTIVPGKNETWHKQPGALFPDVYLKFMAAFADKATGEMQHPVHGVFDAKPVRARAALASTVRGGMTVTFSVEETLDEGDDPVGFFSEVNPIGEARAAATDLDAALAVLTPDPRAADPDYPGMTFLDAIDSIAKAFDQITLLSKKLGGMVDRVLYRIDRVQASIERLGDPQSHPAITACEKLVNATRDLQRTILRGPSKTKRMVVRAETTVAELAQRLQHDPATLIILNPVLAKSPVVPAMTLVTYYVALGEP